MDKSFGGHVHPISRVLSDICEVFTELGFEVVQGPEIEDEYHNFDALNIPPDHPARDMWDTFWLKPSSAKKLLRTHTSPVQIRYMEKNFPPIAIVAPGKVYRHEATDATHEAQFFQIEGLMIDKDVSLAHLKGILETFLKKLFGERVEIRLRPSYFPFVEPGVEVDMSCFSCKGNKCGICKKTGWIEIMGAGMVHPKVLEEVGIDSKKWQGFAFGAGIERIAMLRYGIDDVRLFFTGDLRVITQF